MATVSVVQEYVPTYRVEFFNKLRDRLASDGHEFHLYAGTPKGEQAMRRDSVRLGWETPIEAREYRVFGKRVTLSRLPDLEKSDLVIFEQARRNVALYRAMFRRHRPMIALWGHGRDYVSIPSRVADMTLSALTRRADWFFSYTDAGRDSVVEMGLPAERVTVVQNSTDTEALRALMDSSEVIADANELSERLDLRGQTCFFIGGIEATKRINELVRVADIVQADLPDFRLVVAGTGSQHEWLTEQAKSRQWLHVVGPATGARKAALLRIADVIVVPGRVGLVALDALVAGLPLVTISSEVHAPEFDYLTEAKTCVVSRDERSMSTDLASLLRNPDQRRRMSEQCLLDARRFGVDVMVERFASGVTSALLVGRD